MSVKKFDELSQADQEAVIHFQTSQVLKDISEGYIQFRDENLKARVDKAWEEMESQRTPWFIAERIFEDKELKPVILQMARDIAENNHYSEGVVVIPLEMVRDQLEKANQAQAANDDVKTETKH